MYDDWSYTRTAELLASTGRIHYNGWATAMLGWQLIPAAVLIKSFGFSFTTVRLSTLLTGVASVYLMHRCFTRAGLQPTNASLLALSVSLSPLFLPLTLLFMSDIAGVFAMVVCFYCCLRVLDAGTESKAAVWMCLAGLLSVVGGTARQTAWLGVMIMVPASIWLRKSRVMVLTGVAIWCVSGALISMSLLWFHRQPYSVPESLAPQHVGRSVIYAFLRLGLFLGLFEVPLLLSFTRWAHKWRVAAIAVAGAILLRFMSRHGGGHWVAPFLFQIGDILSVTGLFTVWPEHGSRPLVLTPAVQWTLTGIVLIGVGGLVALRPSGASAVTAWRKTRFHQVSILVLPFMAAYILLLSPRAASVGLYDRYALPLILFGGLLLVMRFERLNPELPVIAWIAVSITAAYSVTVTHDLFALYRATAQALRTVEDAGIPRTALDGGWEYNGWTQVNAQGFVYEPRLHLPGGVSHPDSSQCPLLAPYLFPSVHSELALAFSPNACAGPTRFQPVGFRTWLPLAEEHIYVVLR